ncbi:hypothetical protein CRUP_012356 [Coryphaenoides rupestris]|nr:hypothetical protein CRUP_012356 [Coryphaenoides rupestris]
MTSLLRRTLSDVVRRQEGGVRPDTCWNDCGSRGVQVRSCCRNEEGLRDRTSTDHLWNELGGQTQLQQEKTDVS